MGLMSQTKINDTQVYDEKHDAINMPSFISKYTFFQSMILQINEFSNFWPFSKSNIPLFRMTYLG